MTRITEVEIRDILKLSYVSLVPEENLTIIGGMNEQGKTSLLSGVAMALGGKKLCPAKPIREGKDMAVVRVKIDGDPTLLLPPSTVVRRFFRREDGTIKSEMEIVSDDGYQAPEPQTLLNRLLTNATFDPLYFTRMQPKEQAKQLRELAGIDTQELEQQRAKLYEQRRLLGRDQKQWQGHLDSLPAHHDDVPDAPITAAEIMAEMEEARKRNQENAAKRKQAEEVATALEEMRHEVEVQQQLVESLRTQILEKQALIARIETQQIPVQEERVKVMAEQTQGLEDVDMGTFKKRIQEVDTINAMVRGNEKRKEVAAKVLELTEQYDGLSESITDIDEQIAELYLKAHWPIPGLGFDDNGVTYNGMPFEQCSSAEQLRVSVAMGFALNPKLKLLLIRDGSLLDEHSLQQVSDLAKEHNGQVFLERVGEGNECHLILRDGCAVAAESEVQHEDGAADEGE